MAAPHEYIGVAEAADRHARVRKIKIAELELPTLLFEVTVWSPAAVVVLVQLYVALYGELVSSPPPDMPVGAGKVTRSIPDSGSEVVASTLKEPEFEPVGL